MTESLQEIERLIKALISQAREGHVGLVATSLVADDLMSAITRVVQERDAELERERMRLSACGVGALCNTPDSMKVGRIDATNSYWSASLADVYDAVDREVVLRASLASLSARNAALAGLLREILDDRMTDIRKSFCNRIEAALAAEQPAQTGEKGT